MFPEKKMYFNISKKSYGLLKKKKLEIFVDEIFFAPILMKLLLYMFPKILRKRYEKKLWVT